MRKTILVGLRTLLLTGFLTGILAAAPDERAAEELRSLKERFHSVKKSVQDGILPRERRLAPLREIARLGTTEAEQFLIGIIRRGDDELHGEVLKLLERFYDDSVLTADVFRGHLDARNPYRAMARSYLVRASKQNGDATWFENLFAQNIGDDRFVALRGLGELRAKSTLRYAMELILDKTWEPDHRLATHCGTIATSVEDFEGPKAARVLLLLQRDPRFTKRDRPAFRDATRLWRERHLERYIRIELLAAPDRAERIDAARFMGKAKIEKARAPLTAIARNPNEDVIVRSAALEALGGLELSRPATVEFLARYAKGTDATLRAGAIRGLSQLRTRAAAKLLVELLDGVGEPSARAALVEIAGEPVGDWRAWLATSAALKDDA